MPIEDTNGYDFVVNTFTEPGERRDVRALNVNTVDEVPDSSWFTNRIGRREMAVADVARGPDRVERVSLDGWVVSGGKSSGVQPGFRMTDPAGQLYQIEVDPPSNPELASSAEIIGTAFYHAIGYNTVDVYLAEIDRAALVLSDRATIRDPLNGKRRRMKKSDLDAVFDRAARLPDGRYRVLVSRFAPGKPLGNFRYYGTRPDDPNDIVRHEHRRELRGARVFGAWLNHDDSRGINSLDMLETTDGRGWIKHYMFDFGSILGSGTVYAQRHRPGNEYIFEQRPGWLTLATLGAYIRPWMLIDYPDVPSSVGRLEAKAFDPLKWKPEYPNVAFDNMRGGRRLLGRADRRALYRRDDRRGGEEGAVLRSTRDRVHDPGVDRTSRQGGGRLAQSGLPGRRPGARIRRLVQLHECCGRRAGRRCRRELSTAVVSFRQHRTARARRSASRKRLPHLPDAPQPASSSRANTWASS